MCDCAFFKSIDRNIKNLPRLEFETGLKSGPNYKTCVSRLLDLFHNIKIKEDDNVESLA